MEERNEPSKEQPETMAPQDAKKVWDEPRIAFVEPRLTRHGSLEKVTNGRNGFFGQFSP